jgi:hypothetical protein
MTIHHEDVLARVATLVERAHWLRHDYGETGTRKLLKKDKQRTGWPQALPESRPSPFHAVWLRLPRRPASQATGVLRSA